MFEGRYLHANKEVRLREGVWLGTECLLLWGALISVHGLTHICTYPDVFLYILLFCFRVAWILDCFVL